METNILEYLIGASGISAILIFLSKWIMNNLSKVGIESYKSELKKEQLNLIHEFDVDKEKFRSELEKINLEFGIKQSKLYTDRSEIIRNIYKMLIEAERPLERLLNPFQYLGAEESIESFASEVVEKANTFLKFFYENEIFFSEETSNLFKEINRCYLEAWQTYSRKERFGEPMTGEQRVKFGDAMNLAYEEKLQGEFQKLKSLLQNDFRNQLGVI